MKVFIGTLSKDYLTLNRVLLTSAFKEQPIQVMYEAESATHGWNGLLIEAEASGKDVALLCHEDVYFPEGWMEKFQKGIEFLPSSWIIAGFFGMDKKGKHCGKIRDRRMLNLMETKHELPCEVLNVDGCAFAVNLSKGFRFEELKGFDLYDVYAGLKAKEMGGTVWVIDAPPEHFATRVWNWKPDEVFMENWNWLKQRFPKQKVISTCYADPEG